MKIFLSHARKDSQLARKLADLLTQAGFSVWLPEEEIAPGDNWAKKIGKALEESECMVILLTPNALESDWLRQNIEYALGSKKYEGRLFSVFVAPSPEIGKRVPWILQKLPHRQVESAKQFRRVIRDIKALGAASDMSHSNA